MHQICPAFEGAIGSRLEHLGAQRRPHAFEAVKFGGVGLVDFQRERHLTGKQQHPQER